MNKNKPIKVGVHTNSTDWGIIGHATTEYGAIRVGKRFAAGRVPFGGYAGYRYTITLHYADQPPRQVRM